jgi:hypothetical protein
LVGFSQAADALESATLPTRPATDQANYSVGANVDDATHENYYEETKAALAKFSRKTVFHR